MSYLTTEKALPYRQNFSLFAANCPKKRSFFSSRVPVFWLHHIAALAQKSRNVQILLLEVRHHRVAHVFEGDHFRGGMMHRNWLRHPVLLHRAVGEGLGKSR